MNIQIINPIEYPNWDEFLLTHPETTFFHTSAWAKVLSETYRYRPLYFTIVENGQLTGLIPVMEIKSLLTGKRGVSLPFTDECHPLARDQRQFETLLKYVLTRGKKAGWKHMEMRGGQYNLREAPSVNYHIKHSLKLESDIDSMFKGFKSNVRRNIKRAQRERLQAIISNTWESVVAFCRLNCLTRKLHGLPPQPFKFFRNIFKHLIARDRGFIVLALHRMRPVAGAVFFHFGETGIYKYGASDREFLNLRPNNLVMWEAVRWFGKNGFKELNLGRTDPANEGLLQFKGAWGATAEKQNYYKYDFKKDCFLSASSGPKSSYNVFKRMPVPLLRLTGKLLYRHVG